MTSTVALIVAAGSGERAQGDLPKQYRLLGGKPVLRWSAEAFASHPEIRETRVVIREKDRGRYDDAMTGLNLPPPVIGGDTRQQSVRKGLESLNPASALRVLIHDAARPFVSRQTVSAVIAALDTADGAAPFLAVSDTLRRKHGAGFMSVSREGLLRTQTPQGFRYEAIRAAHEKFAHESVTDDIALLEMAGGSIAAVAGDDANIKLTTPEDFVLAARLSASTFETRTGSGFDVHKFSSGDHVFLCGVKVPHTSGLEGHSDADVGLHALTDAILGALAAGDIGRYFPPSDARWKGTPSHLFLEHAAKLAREANAAILHVDVTLICEHPKISPHGEAMRARIAEILSLDPSRVSVKATTTEGLGFTGRNEGIAAQALATLRFAT